MTESSRNNANTSTIAASHAALYGGLLVIVIIAMLVFFSYTHIRYQRQIQLIEHVHQQLVIASQISADIGEISRNHIAAGISSLRTHKEAYERTLGLIKEDLNGKGIFSQASLKEAFQNTTDVWEDYSLDIIAILSSENSLKTLMNLLDEIGKSIPGITALSEVLVDNQVKNNATAQEVFVATRQLVLMQRIKNGIDEVSHAGLITDDDRLHVYSEIGRDSAIFEQTLRNMSADSQRKVSDRGPDNNISEINTRYHHVSDLIVKILGLESQLVRVNLAVRDINQATPRYLQASESLANTGENSGKQGKVSPVTWSILGGGFLILLCMVIIQARSEARKTGEELLEVTPQELVDYLFDSVGVLVKRNVSTRERVPGRPVSPYIKDIDTALRPVHRRVEFTQRTATDLLSIAKGMHKSVFEIVDVSDGFAQQLNRAGGIVEDLISAMGRALNDAITIKEMLADLHDNPGASDDISMIARLKDQILHLSKRVHAIKQDFDNLGGNVPEVGSIAERIRSEASKINLIALNTAIQTDGDGGESLEIFAADEIQKHAHRVAGATRHLAELGEVFDSIISGTVNELGSLISTIESGPDDQDTGTVDRQPDKNNELMLERIQNVVTVIERQLDAAGEASSCLANLQEAIVGLSAGINDIMAGVEMLEKLSLQSEISTPITDRF